MSLLQLYLLTRLDPLHCLFNALNAVFIVLAICFAIFFLVTEGEIPKLKVYGVYSFFTAIVFSFLTVTVPTKQELYVILGGYYATNNEQVKQLPENILKATNEFLKEYSEPVKEAVKEVSK